MCNADAERARASFAYDRETGALTWRSTRKRPDLVGMSAGTVESVGYVYVRLGPKRHPAHRVIWLMETGKWPAGQIDHIDGNKLNNAWVNLRDVDAHTNAANKHRARSDSKTGLIGVQRVGPRWYAYIYSRGKRHSLGGYETPEKAAAARASAKHEFHKEPNHVD